MKTLRQVEIIPVYVEFVPEELEEQKLYISDEYGVCVHRCLCGCGEKTVLPLAPNEWSYTKNASGKVSLTPSILNNQVPCKSHYIITNNIANFV